MKKLWIKISNFIKRLYTKLVDETKIYIPIAIKVVEVLKQILDSPVDDIILTVVGTLVPNIPANKLGAIKDKIQAELPKILIELNLVNSIAGIEGTNEQLQAVLNALKVLPDNVKAEKYHTLASKILMILSDGKIGWGEAVIFTEWYYQTYIKE